MIAIVTACGHKKQPVPQPAWQLYKSPRIKAVYKRREGHDMFILSAEHGLIPAQKVIAPYERLMDEDRCKELIPAVRDAVKGYEGIVYFRGGARGIYNDCIKAACGEAGVKFVSFGFGFMGQINDMPKMIREIES